MTSSRKGIVDNLSMTYDGNMLASVSDSAPAPSVTGSAAGPMAWKSQGLAVH